MSETGTMEQQSGSMSGAAEGGATQAQHSGVKSPDPIVLTELRDQIAKNPNAAKSIEALIDGMGSKMAEAAGKGTQEESKAQIEAVVAAFKAAAPAMAAAVVANTPAEGK